MEEFENNDNFSIGNQESIFNRSTTQNNNIKKIDENQQNDENSQSFFQFDLFDQNIKVMKTPAKKDTKKLKQYSNKYESLNNACEEIEPALGSDKKQENKSMVSLSDIKESYITRNNAENKQSEITDNSNQTQEVKGFSTSDSDNKNDVEESKPKGYDAVILPPNDNVSPSTKPQTKNDKSNHDDIDDVLPDISWEEPAKPQEPVFENNDYRSTIGELYNKSKLSDPYEKNKYRSFKEIFPSTRISEQSNDDDSMDEIDMLVKSNMESNINCDDVNMLKNLYSLQGMTIKTHNPQNNKNSKSVYTDKNRLNMYTMCITAFIMLVEVIASYFFIKNVLNIYMTTGRLPFYLGCALAVSLALVGILENIFDRFKLVVIKVDNKKELTKRLLVFMIISVIIFAICLAFGMNSLLDANFISYWIISILISSNILVYHLIYMALFSTKRFNS